MIALGSFMLEDFAAHLKMAGGYLSLVALHIITATGAKIMLYRDVAFIQQKCSDSFKILCEKITCILICSPTYVPSHS